MIAAGSLNRSITLQALVAGTPNEWGPTSTWTNIYTCRANVKVEQATESVKDSAVQSRSNYIITIRFNPAIALNSKCRVLYGLKVLDIIGVVDVDEEHRVWVITASEHPVES